VKREPAWGASFAQAVFDFAWHYDLSTVGRKSGIFVDVLSILRDSLKFGDLLPFGPSIIVRGTRGLRFR